MLDHGCVQQDTCILENIRRFGQLQATLARSLTIIFYVELVRYHDAVSFFGAPHSRQGCLHNPMFQMQAAQLEWCEHGSSFERFKRWRRICFRHFDSRSKERVKQTNANGNGNGTRLTLKLLHNVLKPFPVARRSSADRQKPAMSQKWGRRACSKQEWGAHAATNQEGVASHDRTSHEPRGATNASLLAQRSITIALALVS